MRWEMWAHKRPNGDYTEIGDRLEVILYHFPYPIVSVQVTEVEDGRYWGWIREGKDYPIFIYSSRRQFNICFPGGYERSEKLGHGKHVRLNVQESNQ